VYRKINITLFVDLIATAPLINLARTSIILSAIDFSKNFIFSNSSENNFLISLK
ncbi:uncharacterized protein METZ01_LOCUS308717, partial [marine metagenome]